MKEIASKKTKPLLYFGIWNIVEAVLLLAAAILFFAFCTNETMQEIFLVVAASLLIADGSLRVIYDFVSVFEAKDRTEIRYQNAIVGAFELAIGIAILCSDVMALIDIISNFLGIALIVCGAFLVIFAVMFIIKHLIRIYVSISEIIFGAVLITLGTLILIYLTGNEASFLMVCIIILGLLFIIASIVLLGAGITSIKAYRYAVKAAKFVDETEEAVFKGEVDATKEEEPLEGDKPVIVPNEENPVEEKKDEEEPIAIEGDQPALITGKENSTEEKKDEEEPKDEEETKDAE